MTMDQKKLTVLTLLVVVAGAVTVNELVIRVGDKDQNREVASFGERYVPEQIKWEQELAKTVAQDADGKTKVGSRPSMSERFLFEALVGHYDTQVLSGKSLKFTVKENLDPVSFKTEDVLKKYSEVFKNAKSYKTTTLTPTTESLVLKDSKGQDIGSVRIQRTAEGRVVDIEIK
jgi:hypothetical protein